MVKARGRRELNEIFFIKVPRHISAAAPCRWNSRVEERPYRAPKEPYGRYNGLQVTRVSLGQTQMQFRLSISS